MTVSPDIQWFIGLILPLAKEITDRIKDKMITKAALPENLVRAKFFGKITTNVQFSFMLTINLGTTATQTTGYVLLAIIFLLNMVLCYKVTRLNKKEIGMDLKTNMKQSQKEEVLTEFILNETIEVLVPISFIASFSMAYHGPNKTILGNVGSSIWHYHKVEDLHSFFMPIAEMALLDASSFILGGGLLWWFCGINVLKEYCKTIKQYWIYLALMGGGLSTMVIK